MYASLARQFYDTETVAIALMGSHARGEAQAYSDVDLVCITRNSTAPEAQTLYSGDQLVVVSSVTIEQTEAWFSEPKQIVQVMQNLRQAKPLIDPSAFFAELQNRAHQFHWTAEHQRRADDYVAGQMVGLIEEVHKGLNGLEHHHADRLINASHGLAWGLTYILLVHKAVLTSGDNGLIAGAQAAAGVTSEWSGLHRHVFGISSTAESTVDLIQQTRASLQLYKLTFQLVWDACNPTQKQLIKMCISNIDAVLSQDDITP
ncbi:MAG: nucleotidyltransferase domain-containing protein [Aggregatilineales bacterium]